MSAYRTNAKPDGIIIATWKIRRMGAHNVLRTRTGILNVVPAGDGSWRVWWMPPSDAPSVPQYGPAVMAVESAARCLGGNYAE